MTDVYIFATGGAFGLSPCAPIVRHIEGSDEPEFVAAMCTDFDPSGSLTLYFEFDAEEDETSYMLFNSDTDEDVNE